MSTFIRNIIKLSNKIINPLGLHLDSTTKNIQTQRYYNELVERKIYDSPIFPIPESFLKCDPIAVLGLLKQHKDRFQSFLIRKNNQVGFQYGNGYFECPDAEVYYSLIRQFTPKKIIEVGSGNSTLIARQAIIDGNLNTQLISIDPEPRVDVKNFPDEIIKKRVEETPIEPFSNLEANDILFIDSSHISRAGSDVNFLFLSILPLLKPGVLIHVHDVFLPYEYPRVWIENGYYWNEQYLVQAMLQNTNRYKTLWCGFYFQKTVAGFNNYFTDKEDRNSQSLWLEVNLQ